MFPQPIKPLGVTEIANQAGLAEKLPGSVSDEYLGVGCHRILPEHVMDIPSPECLIAIGELVSI